MIELRIGRPHIAVTQLADGEAKIQRKFKSRFPVKVVDMEGNPVNTELGHGSVVRVAWSGGDPSPEYGVPCYMNAVRVVELTEDVGDLPSEF